LRWRIFRAVSTRILADRVAIGSGLIRLGVEAKKNRMIAETPASG
jgi:hypothetical protein